MCLAFWAVRTHSFLVFSFSSIRTLKSSSAGLLSISSRSLMAGIALTQVQHLALWLTEPHEVLTSPLLKFGQIPLDGIPSFSYVNGTGQLQIILQTCWGCSQSHCLLNDKDIRDHQDNQDTALRDSCHCWPPPGYSHNSLAVPMQPVPYLTFKSTL